MFSDTNRIHPTSNDPYVSVSLGHCTRCNLSLLMPGTSDESQLIARFNNPSSPVTNRSQFQDNPRIEQHQMLCYAKRIIMWSFFTIFTKISITARLLSDYLTTQISPPQSRVLLEIRSAKGNKIRRYFSVDAIGSDYSRRKRARRAISHFARIVKRKKEQNFCRSRDRYSQTNSSNAYEIYRFPFNRFRKEQAGPRRPFVNCRLSLQISSSRYREPSIS